MMTPRAVTQPPPLGLARGHDMPNFLKRRFTQILSALMFFMVTLLGNTALSDDGLKARFDALAKANFAQAEKIVSELAATGDPRIVPALEAFAEGDLYARKSDNVVFIGKAKGGNFALTEIGRAHV